HHGVTDPRHGHQTTEEGDAQTGHQPPGRHPAAPAVLVVARVVDDPLPGRRRRAPSAPARPGGAGPAPAASASLCRASRLSATAVRTLLTPHARPMGIGRRPGGASRSRAAAGGRAGLAASGRGTSASLRLRRFATVLAHRTTTPRAGARVRAWKRRLVSGPPEVRMCRVPHSPVLHRGRRRPQASLGSRRYAWRTDYASPNPPEDRSSPQTRQLARPEALM